MNYNPALLIANTILHHFFRAGHSITHMKLQKLIYFVYKLYLKDTGDTLFDEPFLAWQHGPVLRSVYDAFKAFDDKNINRYMLFGSDKNPRVISRQNDEFYQAMHHIIAQYHTHTGWELRGLTSKKDTAWSKAITRQDARLKKVDIWNERWHS
ncbi:MAG: DUF4065 domain-containing protein [Defluviitaleaceae bacterium]|nr:DUF4065 domain-containing protein [Defluviitaleaceae bacterium]